MTSVMPSSAPCSLSCRYSSMTGSPRSMVHPMLLNRRTSGSFLGSVWTVDMNEFISCVQMAPRAGPPSDGRSGGGPAESSVTANGDRFQTVPSDHDPLDPNAVRISLLT